MESRSQVLYDVALSFAGEDRRFVESVVEILKDKRIRIFYDKDEQVFLWGKDIGDTLDKVYRNHSKYVVIFISEHYANKMWTNHERKSAFARAIQEKKEYVLPARFDDSQLDGLRPTVGYIDLREETPETFASKIIHKITTAEPLNAWNENNINAKNESFTREERVVASLRERLRRDFFTSGLRIGQFGKERIPKETQHYQEAARESLKLKPYYYMTYWGWRLMSRLLPQLISEWTEITVSALRSRFSGTRWIEVHLENFDYAPMAPVIRAETVRHTVKAAEIMLLIHQHSIPSQVAWNLVNEADSLMAKDGGWKEFRSRDGNSSLWSSAYVYRFLSKLRQRMCNPEVPGETESFLIKSSALVKNTEEYLEANWYNEKWRFRSVPWEVNAPAVFIECAPFIQNQSLINDAYSALRELISPAGNLITPEKGVPYEASEYVLSIRVAYALKLGALLRNQSDNRVDNIAEWVVDNYSDKYVIDTCDIAFLYWLLHSYSDIAT